MLVSEIKKKYGDINIADEILVSLGYIKKDRMLSASEVKEITGKKNPYRTIERLKKKYGLSYPEKMIASSIIEKEFGLRRI